MVLARNREYINSGKIKTSISDSVIAEEYFSRERGSFSLNILLLRFGVGIDSCLDRLKDYLGFNDFWFLNINASIPVPVKNCKNLFPLKKSRIIFLITVPGGACNLAGTNLD
jgi:hypothetical protein